MTLTLALFYEMTKGKESYWYPYMISMPEEKFLCKWDPYELEMLQDEALQIKLAEYDAGIQAHFDMFDNVLRKHEHIFPKEMQDQKLFEDVYFKVCTRCFGFGCDSTSMIPMADMLNHSSVEINYEIINISLH